MSFSLVVFLAEFLIYSWSKTTITFGRPSVLSKQLVALDFSKRLVPHFTIEGYLFGFYFWLDLLAVVSMVPDIPWIAGPMGLPALSAIGVSSDVGATAKLGRVARMVRLVRLVKLYKAGAKRVGLKKKELETLELMMKGLITPAEFQARRAAASGGDFGGPGGDGSQTRVGAELSDTTTRRVIAIVLLMLCFVPLLSVGETDRAPEGLTRSLQHFHARRDPWNLLSGVVDGRTFFASRTSASLPGARAQPFLVYLEVWPGYPAQLEAYGCKNATPTWQLPSPASSSSSSSPSSAGLDAGQSRPASVCVRKAGYVGGGALVASSSSKGGGGSGDDGRAVRNANDVSAAKGAKLRPSEVLGESGSHKEPGGGVYYSPHCCVARRKAPTNASASEAASEVASEVTSEVGDSVMIEYGRFLTAVCAKSELLGTDGDSQALFDAMYANRSTLEIIFDFFDTNGDGIISREEFRAGCAVLNKSFPKESAIRDPDALLALMDLDGNDEVDVNEFFEVFRLLDVMDGKLDGQFGILLESARQASTGENSSTGTEATAGTDASAGDSSS
mmetsp:Transcript_16481/g.38159  ORF Transcript_16481/g.38159 Transcript_16481/m.38159 type:complete len:560 (-) Transcript_16481:262-1941(-)